MVTAPLGSGTRRVVATMARMAARISSFRHGDDAVDVGLDVGEVAHADTLRAKPVGDGAAGELRRPGDDFAFAKAFAGVAGKFRFDADDDGAWVQKRTAVAVPLSRPPPETGLSTRSTSGMASTISRPQVAWPAMMASSS